MLKPCLFVLVVCAMTETFSRNAFADEPYETWLKLLEGTWTWNDEYRGEVIVTLRPHADGKCVLGTGKDDTGTFVAIIGWEAGIKSLTDTSFHSNGGSRRIVYSEVTATTLRGQRKGSGPGGEPQPDAKFQVVRKGNTLTVTLTDSKGESKTNVLTKKTVSEWINQFVAGIPSRLSDFEQMTPNGRRSAVNARLEAEDKLIGFGSEAIAPLLESMDGKPPKVRRALMRLLMQLRETDQDSAPIIVPRLVAILKTDEDEMIRRMAAFSIADNGRSKGGPHHQLVLTALPALFNALKTDTQLVRLAAATAIGLIAPPSKATINALSEAVASDEDSAVRRFSVEALSRVGSDAAMPALLKALENDVDDLVRDSAISALRHLGLTGQDELPVIINVLKAEKRRSIRREAVMIIFRMGAKAKDAMPAIEEVLTADSDWQNRELAAEYLGKHGGRDQVPTLIKALKDKRPGAREESALALGNIGPEAEDAIPTLQEIYDHELDPNLKQAAFAAIQRIQGKE